MFIEMETSERRLGQGTDMSGEKSEFEVLVAHQKEDTKSQLRLEVKKKMGKNI